MNLNQMIDVDLPSIRQMELDFGALCGEYDDMCSLLMRSIKDAIHVK